ncbi:flagellar hook-basal body complex protein FliE [Alteriqipengyuania lutimaris]|uniref:Flagellar hook-basal body complex protein FliE n=1 Tax=Alteriqipengyuania lutimaris TaxID=1538146 RepID=A0A395LNS5_9SPHN|nr:flagellar hook-basal body complex protein FliE [Alteriqipengyuania lutimaris]MBB3032489.1 flagellar hook-basal body complex protein FliE [Alteriqipengyuania lutimaris]RDS78375.1 flagellar hook-basal body complex protein FliE [Alteriqipengyuania lutimaris]
MSISAYDAATAYKTGLGGIPAAKSGGMSGPPAAGGEDGSFGDLVSGLVADTSTKLHAAEQASIRQVAGKGDLIDVVTAIGAAETALDTVVAVRDRVVGAYGEIMRMQI